MKENLLPWDKCLECWESYKRGTQHENLLHCYKVGIPISSLKIPLIQFIEIIKEKRLC